MLRELGDMRLAGRLHFAFHEYKDSHGNRLFAGDANGASGVRSQRNLQSRPLEINMWMWRYGRTILRQFSVEQTVEMHKKRAHESRARGAETLRRRHMKAHAKGAFAQQ